MRIAVACVFFLPLFAPRFVFIKFSQAKPLPFVVFFSLNLLFLSNDHKTLFFLCSTLKPHVSLVRFSLVCSLGGVPVAASRGRAQGLASYSWWGRGTLAQAPWDRDDVNGWGRTGMERAERVTATKWSVPGLAGPAGGWPFWLWLSVLLTQRLLSHRLLA